MKLRLLVLALPIIGLSIVPRLEKLVHAVAISRKDRTAEINRRDFFIYQIFIVVRLYPIKRPILQFIMYYLYKRVCDGKGRDFLLPEIVLIRMRRLSSGQPAMPMDEIG